MIRDLFDMKTYLLIGGGGFLGANLASVLSENGMRVIVYERPEADVKKLDQLKDKVEIVRGFMSEENLLLNIITANNVKVVVHLASSLLPSSNQSEYLEEIKSVVVPTFRIIKTCAAMNIRFVFFSTGGAIYGDAGEEKLSESHKLNPISYYGLCKVQIEEYIQFESVTSGLNYLVLRPSNPYGRFQSLAGRQGFISVALGKILKNEPIDIWGDGSSVRDYIWIHDLLLAFYTLEKIGIKNTIINIGSGVGSSILEVIKILEKVTGKTAVLNFKSARSVDVKSVVLDIKLLKSKINFEPTILEEGVKKYWSLIRTRYD